MKINTENAPSILAHAQKGETPLHMAVRNCHLPVVNTLLDFLNGSRLPAEACEFVNEPNHVSNGPWNTGADGPGSLSRLFDKHLLGLKKPLLTSDI